MLGALAISVRHMANDNINITNYVSTVVEKVYKNHLHCGKQELKIKLTEFLPLKVYLCTLR